MLTKIYERLYIMQLHIQFPTPMALPAGRVGLN